MKISRSQLMITVGSLAWLMLVIVLFYAGHKPFSTGVVLRIVNATGQIIVSLIIVSLGGGLGRKLIHPCEINPLSMLALQSGVGLGMISIGIFIVGSLIGINSILCWIFAFLLGLFLWRDTWAWLLNWRALSPLWAGSGRFGKILGFGLLSLFLCTMVTSLAPPVKFDALVYHLSLPKIYLLSGVIRYIPEIMFWGMPQVSETLYTWGMGLAGTATASMLGWWVGVIAITGLIGYTLDRFGNNPAWVAATSLMSGYTMTILLASAYVEWFAALFGIALIIALDTWWAGKDRFALLWAGVLCGFAMGSKYTGGVLLIAGAFVVCLYSLQNKTGINKFVKNLVILLAPALLVFSPWLIKNLVATGNPVYPLFFPSGSVDRFRLDAYQLPPWGGWKDIFLLPLQATMTGFEGAPGYSASISPLLIALVPFSFIGYKKRTDKQRITLVIASSISITGCIAWMLANRYSGYLIQTRLYFGIFPAFAVLAGAGFQALADIRIPGLRLGRIISVLVVIVLLFNIIQVMTEFVGDGALKVLLNQRSEEEYLGDNLGWYTPATTAIRALPDHSRVLMLWEPRSYYCLPECIPDEILDQWRHARQTVGEPADIIVDWQDKGYTHLLYNRFGADFVRSDDGSYQDADWVALNELISQLGPPVEFGGAYELYSLQQ